jgi:hypothetical protein
MLPEQEEELPKIKATISTEAELSWVEHQRKENQDTPRRLEDIAKFLSGLFSISLIIILSPYSEVLKANKTSRWLQLGVGCWLVSLLFTLAVVFPFRYRYISNSEISIREMHNKIVRIKFFCLLSGTLLYLAGISLVACVCLFTTAG